MDLRSLLADVPDEQLQHFEELAELFVEWNQKLNLSAIRDKDGVLLKHVVDSLLICPFALIKKHDQVLDLGTGGGFPGLALAIVYPNSSFTLIDATEKKIKAVQNMADSIGLKNVRCFSGRAEALGHDPGLREHFDVVVARALAGFSTLLEYCIPFVKTGGKLVAYQGPELSETWNDFQLVAEKLRSRISEVKQTQLPLENAQRSFIIVEKMGPLEAQYPRKVGLPKKKPL